MASNWRSIGKVSAAAFCGGAGMAAQRALQRALDVAVRRVPRQVVEPVHFSQCRQPPSDRGGRMAVGQAGEVGADGRRRRRDRDKTVRGAPLREMRPVGLVGAQGGGGRGLFGQRLGGGQCGRAGLGRCGQSGGDGGPARIRRHAIAGRDDVSESALSRP